MWFWREKKARDGGDLTPTHTAVYQNEREHREGDKRRQGEKPRNTGTADWSTNKILAFAPPTSCLIHATLLGMRGSASAALGKAKTELNLGFQPPCTPPPCGVAG